MEKYNRAEQAVRDHEKCVKCGEQAVGLAAGYWACAKHYPVIIKEWQIKRAKFTSNRQSRRWDQ